MYVWMYTYYMHTCVYIDKITHDMVSDNIHQESKFGAHSPQKEDMLIKYPPQCGTCQKNKTTVFRISHFSGHTDRIHVYFCLSRRIIVECQKGLRQPSASTWDALHIPRHSELMHGLPRCIVLCTALSVAESLGRRSVFAEGTLNQHGHMR